MKELQEKGIKAKEAYKFLVKLSTHEKNQVLEKAARLILEEEEYLLTENKKDLTAAKANNITGALLDRLTLTHERLEGISEGLQQVAKLDDPVGEVLSMKKRPNGLTIGQVRVPLGVIGIIYEARPNVTADAFALCLKTGNPVILRGGKEAIHSNKALVKVIQKALTEEKVTTHAIQLVENTTRESAVGMMKMNEYLDVLIPRGGAGLIKTVVENSSVPVLETGVGNCHTFIDDSADQEMAKNIAVNAKTHRPGVCNAMESLLVHENVAAEILPDLCNQLNALKVEIRGDETVTSLIPYAKPATEEDWGKEYLDMILSVKVVASLDEAIEHISKYGTGHSETIVTENYTHSQRFLQEVDAAAVYVNASTRFTDGFEFGFGAEIGISTQKLHARGPMGLKELTTSKYIVYGNGQIR